MIYTLTLNPAIDVYVDKIEDNSNIIKVKKNRIVPGGKGINVSLTLKKLGMDSTAIVVLGGVTGGYIKRELTKFDINLCCFEVPYDTRINYKINSSNNELAYNMLPNDIQKDTLIEIKKYLDKLSSNDFLVVAGTAKLEDYVFLLSDLKAKLVLDVNGSLLKELIKYKPLIVKPNKEELEEFEKDNNIAYTKLLKYCKIIINTLGSEGSILKTADIELKIKPEENIISSSVGCGDAYLAGFIFKYINGSNLEDSFHFGSKCAYFHSKNCFSLNENKC